MLVGFGWFVLVWVGLGWVGWFWLVLNHAALVLVGFRSVSVGLGWFRLVGFGWSPVTPLVGLRLVSVHFG